MSFAAGSHLQCFIGTWALWVIMGVEWRCEVTSYIQISDYLRSNLNLEIGAEG